MNTFALWYSGASDGDEVIGWLQEEYIYFFWPPYMWTWLQQLVLFLIKF